MEKSVPQSSRKSETRSGLARSAYLLLFLLLLPIGSCGHEGSKTTTPRNVLVMGLASEPDSLNVYLSRTTESLIIANRTLPRLAEEVLPDARHEGGLIPSLAQSWEFSEDGLDLSFHLTPGRHWSDGSDVNCDDLVFTLRAQTDPAVGWRAASIKRHIKGLSCPDPLTAVFHFDTSYPGQLMDVNDLHVLPRALATIPFEEWRQTDWTKALLSAGPYRVERVEAGQQIVLESVPDWGGPPAKIKRLVLRIVPDATSRVTQFLSGNLDLVDRLSPEEASRFTSAEDVTLVRRPSFRYTYLGYNTIDPAAYLEYRRYREADCRRTGDEACLDEAGVIAEIARTHPHPIFGDPQVRRAMTMAIDRETLVDTLLLGEGEIPPSPFLAPLPEHDPNLKPWPYNPQTAEQLFHNAGFERKDGDAFLRRKDGTPLSFRLFVQSGNAQRMQAATLIQQQMLEYGIQVSLEAVENSSFYATISAHDTDAWIGGWRVSLRVDATENLHENACGSGGMNFGSWTHPEADRIASRAKDTRDDEERTQAWRRWEQYFHSEQPYSILFRPTTLTAVRSDIVGPSEEIRINDPLAGVEHWSIGVPAE